jgi:peptidyl-prolyl cis-trans isomerase A (cyclophilin A)
LHTTAGDIRVNLFGDQAPKTVRNFTELALGSREWTHPATREKTSEPLYDGTIFHRVIPNFMIQGGDPLGQGYGGPGYQFGDEFHPELVFDRPYLLAMANAGPGTNGSQFFITVVPTPHLNRKHTIFGEVADADSRTVVNQIATTKTGRNDRPVKDVTINSVEVTPISGRALGGCAGKRLERSVQPRDGCRTREWTSGRQRGRPAGASARVLLSAPDARDADSVRPVQSPDMQ